MTFTFILNISFLCMQWIHDGEVNVSLHIIPKTSDEVYMKFGIESSVLKVVEWTSDLYWSNVWPTIHKAELEALWIFLK